MSKRSREKGARRERELVNLHRNVGVRAERVPLSGATKYKGNDADLDVYAFGPDSAPLVCENKARETGSGFKTIERWLGDHDALFLERDQALPGRTAPPPIVVLPWKTWLRVLKVTRRQLL